MDCSSPEEADECGYSCGGKGGGNSSTSTASSSNNSSNSSTSVGGGGSSNKRGVLPKQATNVMRSWLFQHIVVRINTLFPQKYVINNASSIT